MNSLYTRHAINADQLADQVVKFTTAAQTLAGILPPELIDNRIVNANALIEAVVPRADYLTEAADLVLDGQDPSEAMSRYAAAVHIQDLVATVRKRAKARQADAINAGADKIIGTLRAEVFEPAVARLLELDLDPADTIDKAIARQDFKAAETLKEATNLTDKLTRIDTLRRVLHPGAYDTTAAFTTEPDGLEAVDGTTTPSGLHWWLDVIGTGNAHYPTLREWSTLHNSKAFNDYRESTEDREEDEWAFTTNTKAMADR